MVRYEKLTPPTSGGVIRFDNGQPVVPDNPIVPFIRGDGTGVDIWPAASVVLSGGRTPRRAVDAAKSAFPSAVGVRAGVGGCP